MNKKGIYITSFLLVILFFIFCLLNNNYSKTVYVENIPPVIENHKYNYEDDNKDVIGKIRINGTNINYSLVQGKDNEYYLNHSIQGKKDSSGSIFLDYRNDLNDRKLLIYGHNSRVVKDALFHDLEKYIKKSFFKDNMYINLTINEKEYIYQIFSIMIVEENKTKHMKINFSDSEWNEHIKWMKNNSLYETGINVSKKDKIITLQTCYYNSSNSYLIINAKKI